MGYNEPMKRNELLKVCEYLQQFRSISSIGRVDDSVIKIVFNRNDVIFIDLKRGDSHIFKKDDFKRTKIYNAPFDVVLHKRLARSKINSVHVQEGNRILLIEVQAASSYKSINSTLHVEFTGRNTNCIILDENGIILEAWRHIDDAVSSRSVKVGEGLNPLAPRVFDEQTFICDDVEKYLYEAYQKRASIRLGQIKNNKLIALEKKKQKVLMQLQKLSSEEVLQELAEKYTSWATLLLAKLHEVKDYEKHITLEDFSGDLVKIDLPKEARSASEAANMLFAQAKKLKRKAKYLYKQRQNLQEKVDFYEKLAAAITCAKDAAEVNILYPKQKNSRQKNEKNLPIESFFVEGFKIMLGKNEAGNLHLLKEAKKSDIWLHLQNIASSHVIIRTDKQNVPQNVLEFAAKLCVQFSVAQAGAYLVDYTHRRNVKILEGANVNYVEYKTLRIDKE